MVLIKKWQYYMLLLFTCVLLLVLGAVHYRVMNEISVLTPLQIKFYSENSIFISIVSIVIMIIVFFLIMRRSIYVMNELDKITQLSKHGRYYSGDSLKRLGSLGDKIDNLYLELNRLNDMKSIKISTLSNVNQFFLENIHLKLVITDVQGTILHCSGDFLEYVSMEKSLVISKPISTFIVDFNFQEITSEVEKTRKPILQQNLKLNMGDKSQTGSFEFFPIFNSRNELSSIICINEKESVLTELSKKADLLISVSKTQKKITDLFKRTK
jgi:transcriptional regulator with PAS, ATPase and Fis domain